MNTYCPLWLALVFSSLFFSGFYLQPVCFIPPTDSLFSLSLSLLPSLCSFIFHSLALITSNMHNIQRTLNIRLISKRISSLFIYHFSMEEEALCIFSAFSFTVSSTCIERKEKTLIIIISLCRCSEFCWNMNKMFVHWMKCISYGLTRSRH